MGLGFRRDRRGSPQVLQVYFAAGRDSLDVAAPGDCSSAIKPKMEHRPIFLPAIPFLVEPIKCWTSTVANFRRHSATHRVSLNLGIFCFSMFASWPQISAVCPSAITWASGAESRRSWPLSFDRDARAHCIRDMTATYHPPGTPEEFAGKSSHTTGPSDSSGRNTVWNFTSSVTMIVGAAERTRCLLR